MEISGYPVRTKAGALTRGTVRTVFLFGLAAVALSWSLDESTTGNGAVLWSLAALLAVVGGRGLVETGRELKIISQRNPRRTY